MNIPNQLTMARLGLSLVLFVLLYFSSRISNPDLQIQLMDVSIAVFVIAGLTDFLDGYFARKWNMQSHFGRIADPLMDKILICGTFIFFLSFPLDFLKEWMVVVIISREFIVNGLRGYVEAQGKKFGANQWGKLKMVIQTFTVFWILLYLAHLQEFLWAKVFSSVTVWVTLAITLWSGLTYIFEAKKLLSEIA